MSISLEENRELIRLLNKVEDFMAMTVSDQDAVQPLYEHIKKMKTVVDKRTVKKGLVKNLPFKICVRKYYDTWEKATRNPQSAYDKQFRVPNIHEINQIVDCGDENIRYHNASTSMPETYWLANSNCPDYALAIQFKIDGTHQIITAKKDSKLSYFYITDK